ncbi:VacJ family lipoprotein [Ferrovibrio sp.]|uniref:MlaA family lipoprotein n=1 Tax=Ferrovibrio sp. TaxID=1917215 RepID=UPI001B649108|nr:VacJ family lipoprotein [Ferrovibrio sp.]MBP7065595.1 VacJ family lipoprotein [Ferrovibrio sp.]
MKRHHMALIGLLLLAQPAQVQAQNVAPAVAAEIAAILQQAGIDQARERASYGSLGNGQILATKERQLEARVGRDLATIVGREAVYDRRRAQETAAYIARVAPSFGPQAYQAAASYAAAAPAALPNAWYQSASPPPASPPIRPTQYVAGPSAGRPGQWYDSPYLARYGGSQSASSMPAASFTQASYSQASYSQAMPQAMGAGTAGSSEIWDPIEPVNRAFFAFNEVVDTFLLRPIAWLYSFTPDVVKGGLRSAFTNLKSPAVLLNHTLQGNLGDAATTVGRFAVNSTVGVLGLWDAADDLLDWKGKPADFGQTLHSYGIGEGPFLMLPLLGPANLRDALGNGVDNLADPLVYILNDNANLALTGAKVLVRREELLKPLDELRAGSLDYYATLRSSSQQQRRAFLRGANPADAAAARQAADDLFNQAQ